MAQLHPSNLMKQVIIEIANLHGFDLYAGDGSGLVIQNSPYMDLHVTAYSKGAASWMISVDHHYYQNSDTMYDPEIVFWASKIDGVETWVACVWNTSYFGYLDLITFDDKMQPAKFYRKLQHDTAAFANDWAQNIIDQGFVKRAQEFAATKQQAEK